MKPQELKSSILHLAIQGKLVPQIPEEGTGEELFRQIQTEKQCLIKAGAIKKEKLLHGIAEDEIPFDLPDGWCWTRLESICSLITDGTHKTPSYTTSGIRFLSVKDISDGYIDLSNTKFISESEHTQLTQRCKPEIGDVLICRIGTLGKALSIDIDLEFSIFVSLGLIKPIHKELAKYIETVINSGYGYAWIQRVKVGGGTHTFKINLDDLRMFPIPLPPLAEQKRIVAKIEELLPLIDCYEQAWSRLEDFNRRFPVDMQKSILQMAIQGKLVEQRLEEGTGEELYQQIQAEKHRLIKVGIIKKEKSLSEIVEDEIPFDIPESWRWVRFADVIDVRDGTHDTPKYVNEGIPLVTSKNLVNGEIDFETTKLISYEDAEQINMRSAVDDSDILFAMIGTIGNPVLVKKDREFCIKNMALFKAINHSLIDMKYFLLFLQNEQYAMKKKASGGVQSFVSLKFLRNYLLPLPPVAEQKRIVAKLEEILPLCELLK